MEDDNQAANAVTQAYPLHGMTAAERALITAFELHSAAGISRAVAGGVDVLRPIAGKPPLDWLIEMHTRSDRFPDCMRVMADQGAAIADGVLNAVLLDDDAALATLLAADPSAMSRRVRLRCAFTPLYDTTLLHVAAEFGHIKAVRALIAAGADVNARAGLDAEGLGGHTPIFHTVNSHANRSVTVMRELIAAGADCATTIPGLVWGHGFEWETVCLDVTPVSYAQLGLLPQMHRKEADIVANIRELLSAAGREPPAFANVPNRYVTGAGD